MRPVTDIDTIMYGVLSNSSMIDFEGHLTKVFFTAGCNFRCGFCHNAEMVHAKEGNLSWEKVTDILETARQDEWVDAVCISGGEPTMHADLGRVIEWLRQNGFYVKLDTNGSMPGRLEPLLEILDYVAMDYKAPLDSYHVMCGVKGFEDNVKKSAHMLMNMDRDTYELRTTVIKGFHTKEVMEQIGTELQGVKKYVLQPFVPHDSLYDPDFAKLDRTDAGYMEEMRDVVQQFIPATEIRGVGQ